MLRFGVAKPQLVVPLIWIVDKKYVRKKKNELSLAWILTLYHVL